MSGKICQAARTNGRVKSLELQTIPDLTYSGCYKQAFIMAKILLSFFDFTGNWSKPFAEDEYWHVETFDIKNGQDIMDFDPSEFMSKYLHSALKYTLP